VKRIAILFALAAFAFLPLAGCSDKHALSGTTFPDDVEFVVVDALPESETASQGDDDAQNVCVCATFVDGDSPACAVPVVLYQGDSAVFAALTDDAGRVACGSLPVDTAILFSVTDYGGNALSLSVRFVSFGQTQSAAAYARQGIAVVVPVAQANGTPYADLLFLMDAASSLDTATVSAAADASITPVTDPLHLWSRTTLTLS